MKPERIKYLKGLILVLTLLLLVDSCSVQADQAVSAVAEPTFNLIAVADFSAEADDFNQVLLKMELLDTPTDILKYGIQTPEAHQQRLEYYRTQFKNDAFLLAGKDTIPCYDLHAERLFMDLPYMNFILTFQHPLAETDELLIHDLVYTNKSFLVTIDPKMPTQ